MTNQSEAAEALNAAFAVPDRVVFATDPGGFPLAHLRGPASEASVDLQGADVTHFRPLGQRERIIWVSEYAVYAPGKAIRGGIPICWPWFGPHPTDPTKPDHGFARTRPWSVLGVDAGDAETTIRLGLQDDESTRALWPHPFALEFAVTAGAGLHAVLTVRNTGVDPFSCTGALHSYFAVGDVTRVSIHGLDGCTYLDKVAGGRSQVQRGPISIAGETDRVYVDTAASCTIDDPALGRRILVAKGGSRSTVVWNPWRDKARRLKDFGDEEYRGMVCVETANAGDDTITIAPGAEHRLETWISLA